VDGAIFPRDRSLCEAEDGTDHDDVMRVGLVVVVVVVVVVLLLLLLPIGGSKN